MIFNRQRKVRVAGKPLETFLRRVEKELGVNESSVTVCFVSDAEIARMNERFRRKKGATDVLSFPAEKQWRVASDEWREKKGNATESTEDTEKRGLGRDSKRRKWKRYLGDIAIAPETARRYAKKNGRTLDSELRVLILHGVLHLLGYDHESDRGEMDRIEQRVRRRLGLA